MCAYRPFFVRNVLKEGRSQLIPFSPFKGFPSGKRERREAKRKGVEKEIVCSTDPPVLGRTEAEKWRKNRKPISKTGGGGASCSLYTKLV